MLSDFGISRLSIASRAITTTKELAGSLRWMAIEFFLGAIDNGNDAIATEATKETDVWAFGMTVSVRALKRISVILSKLDYIPAFHRNS